MELKSCSFACESEGFYLYVKRSQFGELCCNADAPTSTVVKDRFGAEITIGVSLIY